MDVLVYLVPLALGLGGLGLAAFLWSLKTGQYDDLDGAAWRAIMDDDTIPDSARAAPGQDATGSTVLTNPTEPGRKL
ncbi:cbb3-type cytochrome oxidase assembly protein CcoS [Phreatobacter cathodiphilus]|uniref:Cbb3-type cytochrome oxidase assembly protein CcoS n=1 Tax=Phreatobacter cathodiphilus TaxID=1868589 RepID=A0A2S0NCU7_9HYPH|nr:cbb3-type cytochrome oxidase assembly protein CcoS [Phreatobacter cathodiphilus]